MPTMQSQSVTVSEFRELREELGISYQQIVERTEENGESVSIATVKRVFAAGAEAQKFKPETLNAIGKVLFDEKLQKQQSIESAPSHEIEALNSLLAFNKLTIETLEKENEHLQAEYDKKLAYIKNEAAQKQTHIVALTEQIKRKDRANFWLVLVLIVLLSIIIIALVIDKVNPDLGYFWRNMSAALLGDGNVSGQGMTGAGKLILFKLFGGR